MQNLIHLINQSCINVSYKVPYYLNLGLGQHYGTDMASSNGSTKLWSPGNGKVLAVGNCTTLGNYIVLLLPSCLNWKTGKVSDLVMRMYHLHSIAVKVGQPVDKDTTLGNYGNTGTYSKGAHLHLEVDTDTKNPYFTPTISGVAGIFKGKNYGANDKTMSNPLEWLHCKASAPDKQTYTTSWSLAAYVLPADKTTKTIN